MEDKLTALICPLDWGLGHASRDILLVKELINKGFNVILGGDGSSLELLHQEFPLLQTIKIPSVNITYSRSGSMIFKIIGQVPRLINGIITEHKSLKRLLKKTKIDLVISDNRFGLWNKGVYCIYITHQLWIKFPGLLNIFEWLAYIVHKSIISRYNECWIPDTEDPDYNLSGKLAHVNGFPRNGSFSGIFSRFLFFSNITDLNIEDKNRTDILAIVSGPEPQRTIFEEVLVNRLEDMPYNALIIRGLPENPKNQSSFDHIRFKNHLPVSHFYSLLKTSKYIICRSGYSTLMDLAAVGRKAILIPTPGQPEQEYLADYFQEKYGFVVYSQKNPDLQKAIQDYDLSDQKEFYKININNELKKKVNQLKIKLLRLRNIEYSNHGNQS